jgi:hypothetical protein
MARPVTKATRRGLVFDLLTFERPVAAQLVHLIYWCGLGVVVLISFGVVGGAVGMLIRGGPLEGVLLSLPVLVGGLLLCAVLGLLWRGVCEFCLAVFRIADDLSVVRGAIEREQAQDRDKPRITPLTEA